MRVFVYGSLRRDERAHKLLAGAPLVSASRSSVGWQLLDLGRYPAATLGQGRIQGEIYQVSEPLLARLDAYEGPHFVRVPMQTHHGPVWIYRYRRPANHLARIPSGDWRAHSQQTLLYFAYGSNMASARLRGRIPTAQPLFPAHLAAHRLTFTKPGQDGTAKCAFESCVDSELHGVVYRISARDKARLDGIEGSGYDTRWLSLRCQHGTVRAFGYRARARVMDQQPRAEYLAWVRRGAREHGLPESYCRALEALSPGKQQAP